MSSTPITIAYGNGIGPEIMAQVLKIMSSAGADIAPEVIEIGEDVYKRGIKVGIEEGAWDSLHKTKVFLKAPVTTPQGGGFHSLNVAIRRKLGLYANVRPCRSYHPFVATKHPEMDLVIIRENEEDLYTGIEYRQTQEVVQCLKLISRSGSHRISSFAFEYVLKNNRKKLTCFTKDNIMKRSDGLFRHIFESVGKNYPDIEQEHWIVDIGAAKMADTPENFDVLVLPNLYGDILSDVSAQISGSVGMAGSANIGDKYAMFEAIHGSAPRRAGQDLANPSGLLQAAVLMLVHIGQVEPAERIQNSWLKTLESGIHTYDIYREGVSHKKVGTKEFAQAIIDRLGEGPERLKPVSFSSAMTSHSIHASHAVKTQKGDPDVASARGLISAPIQEKVLVGVDVFVDEGKKTPQEMAKGLKALLEQLDGSVGGLKLKSIFCRGVSVWPKLSSEVLLSDHWQIRFGTQDFKGSVQPTAIIHLLKGLHQQNWDFIKIENLYLFNGERGFASL